MNIPALLLFLLAQGARPAPVPGMPPDPGVYYREGNAWNKLQAAPMADMKTKGVGLFLETDGLSGLDLTIDYQGPQAPVQIQDQQPTFYVRRTGAAADAMIVELERKKDRRTIRTSSSDATVENRGGFKKDSIRNVTVIVYSDDSFSVTPEQVLKPGEYLLVFGHANTGFDFGIQPKDQKRR